MYLLWSDKLYIKTITNGWRNSCKYRSDADLAPPQHTHNSSISYFVYLLFKLTSLLRRGDSMVFDMFLRFEGLLSTHIKELIFHSSREFSGDFHRNIYLLSQVQSTKGISRIKSSIGQNIIGGFRI